ncbi:MAG: tetratricopeptide repeat protein [Sulfurimonas sp.]|jgi:tetratricopeptide (TPR) repeat protein
MKLLFFLISIQVFLIASVKDIERVPQGVVQALSVDVASTSKYPKRIMLGAYSIKEKAYEDLKRLQEDEVYAKLNILATKNDFVIHVRPIYNHTYTVLVIEPIKDKEVYQEVMDLVKPKFKGAYSRKSNLQSIATQAKEEEKSLPVAAIPATLTQPATLQEDQKSSYNKAKLLFEEKEYQQAYDTFYKLFENNLQDPNINFYLGRSAYMLKDFELAITAFERVLMIDPNSTRSKLEIAKCYFELKEYKKAQNMFLSTIKENMPVNVKQNIELYLSAINSKIQTNFFSGSAVLGINYDTNINNRATSDTFTIPGIVDSITNQPIKTANSTKDEAGLAHQEAISLNHMYNFAEEVNIKNDFVLFSKSLLSDRTKDIGLIQYSPALSVVYNGKILVDYALLFDKIWLSTRPLLNDYGIYPKLKYMYSPSIILGTTFKYQKKFLDTSISEVEALEFTLNHIYSKDIMFTYYTQFYTEKKLSSNLTNVSQDMLNIALSASYKYMPTLTFTPKIQWYDKPYKEEDPFYLKEQQDNEYQFLFNTTYSYNKSVLMSLDYMYTEHISNIPSWEFNKHAITANVILLF